VFVRFRLGTDVAVGDTGWFVDDVAAVVAAPPAVATGSAPALTETSATLSATVDPQGGDTATRIEYGPTTAYGSSAAGPSLPAGAGGQPIAVQLTGLSPNTAYHFRVVAVSAAGASAGADASFRTAGASRTNPPPPPPAPRDRTRPRLTMRVLVPAAFTAARRGASVVRRGGTLVRLTLSEAATLRVRVEHARAGRRQGRTCVALTRRNRGARACTRWLTVRGAINRRAPRGASAFRFSGRLGTLTLPPGRYRLRATASDAARNLSPAVRRPFRIVRARR